MTTCITATGSQTRRGHDVFRPHLCSRPRLLRSPASLSGGSSPTGPSWTTTSSSAAPLTLLAARTARSPASMCIQELGSPSTCDLAAAAAAALAAAAVAAMMMAGRRGAVMRELRQLLHACQHNVLLFLLQMLRGVASCSGKGAQQQSGVQGHCKA